VIVRKWALALAASLGLALPGNATAETLPTMRGVDHVGVTVYDSKAAIEFFETVLGCKAYVKFGPFRDDKGPFMQNLLNVHPRAVINQITLVRCGNGSNVELLEYRAPDQKSERPKNSDLGGHHIAFYVDDIAKAVAYLKANKVKTFFGPLSVKEGPAAGQTIIYFTAPWGLQMELISYPKGMAYEKTAKGKLWSPRDQ
jgi:catechol 2,3-dioxygenase-like lactoylglutathione lyase family enzyme